MTEPGQQITMFMLIIKKRKRFKKSGPAFFVCPGELTFKELKERDCDGDEMLVYGRIPVADKHTVSEKVQDTVENAGLFKVRDRKGKEFPVKTCQLLL